MAMLNYQRVTPIINLLFGDGLYHPFFHGDFEGYHINNIPIHRHYELPQ